MAAAVASAKASILASAGKAASLAKAVSQNGEHGEHGSVFQLAEHLDVDIITAMVVGLILFTILFEIAIHKIEHYLSSNIIYLECLRKVFKELTIMGFISFILLLIHEFVKVPFHEHLCFEFAHIWIFFVALVFILHSVIFMAALSSSEKKFKLYDSTKHHNAVMSPPTLTQAIVGASAEEAVLSYHVAKEVFREHNGLKPSFDFRKYVTSFVGETIVELLDTTELTWCLIIVLFLLNLGRNHLVDYMNGTTENYASIDHPSSLAELAKLPHSQHVSFFSLTHEQQEELLGGLGYKYRKIWTFMTFGWIIFVTNCLCMVWCRFITNRLLYDARIHVGRDTEKEGELSEEWDEKKMRARLPCGRMKIFTVTLEFITMIQCFYFGLLLLLNARTAYGNYPPPFGFLYMVVMFVPVATNLFVVYPAHLKNIAFLAAITESKHNLKHEVVEYQHAMLVDFHHKVKKWLHDISQSPEQAAAECFEKCKSKSDDGKYEVPASILYPYLKRAGIVFKEDQFFVIFKQLDEDDSGVVDQAELVHLFSSISHAPDHDEETGKGHGGHSKGHH